MSTAKARLGLGLQREGRGGHYSTLFLYDGWNLVAELNMKLE